MEYDLGVITPFPVTEKKKNGGAARFIKQIVDEFHDKKIIILSENQGDTTQIVTPNGIISPTWTKKVFAPFGQISKKIIEHKIPIVLLNFEFGAYGGILGLLWLAALLLQLKILKVKVVTIYHPALLTYRELQGISGNLGISSKSLSLWIYSIGMRWYSLFLSLLSDAMVVFEDEFKQRLVDKGVQSSKVTVIPHQIYGADKKSQFEKQKKFTILCFGFIVPYKGIELIAESNSYLDKSQFEYLVVGGKSPTNLSGTYYEEMEKKMANSGVKHIDYVTDDEIPGYFERSDLVVFPYLNLMASSGPLAWAIGEERPFILSDALAPYLETFDFKKAMQELGLRTEQILFSRDPHALALKINNIRNDNQLLDLLGKLSLRMKEFRSTKVISNQYYSLLFKV